MGFFSRDMGYDRSRLMLAAERARAHRRRRRAIQLYRQVLAVEPGNWDVYGRLGPLLAETRQRFDAWVHFRTAAEGFRRDGNLERALEQYRIASRYLPREVEVWPAIAELERKKGRDRSAVEALLDGRRCFRRRTLRGHAAYLLRRAREIDPWDSRVVIDLAWLLARRDQKNEARSLLDGLAERARGRSLRRVRGAQWRIHPTPGNGWRWLCAAFSSRPGSRSRRALPLRRDPTVSATRTAPTPEIPPLLHRF